MTFFRRFLVGTLCAVFVSPVLAAEGFGSGSGSSFGLSKQSGGFAGASLGASEAGQRMQQIATDAQVKATAATGGVSEETARAVVSAQNASIDTSGSALLNGVSTSESGGNAAGVSSSGDNSGDSKSQSDNSGGGTETSAPQVDNSQKIAEAQKAYDDAKAKEQSTANKMLGGATMAATGIGGMQLAQGLAEKSADAAAESDMAAYLQTFQCRVADKTYKGGEFSIPVGGGNELIELYQQYVDMAADLKERKNALGLKAGIESEVVMDKANMGLYDDVGHGIENGTFASLYRASKGNEKDKSKLDDAKDTSANRVKYGGIAAGVGAVGGLVGNAIINGGDDEEENVTEEDCKKAGGTFKDKKCTCKDKNKKYKNGKCVEKSDSDSGIDLSAIGANLVNNLGSGAAGLLQGAAGGDGGGAAGLLQSAGGLLGQ